MDNAEVELEKARTAGTRRGLAGWLWTVLGPFAGLALIVLLFAYLTRDRGSFLTVYAWRTILVHTVVVATCALGMTVIMIAGGIDLSVGSAVALVTVAMALAVRDLGVPIPLAMLGGVLLGGLCGLLNGALAAGLRVVPFIITLGTLKAFRGVAKWLASNSEVYAPASAKPWWFKRIMAIDPNPEWLLVSPGVWVVPALAVLVAVILRYSVLGRHIYAVGSNEATARVCGVRVGLVKLSVYALAGLAVGLAGVLQFVFLGATGDSTTAEGLELQVIAAVVIGGGSLSGGEGSVVGTLIGCLIMAVLNNGCVQAQIPNAFQDIVIGVIIVSAVALDQLRRKTRREAI